MVIMQLMTHLMTWGRSVPADMTWANTSKLAAEEPVLGRIVPQIYRGIAVDSANSSETVEFANSPWNCHRLTSTWF